MEAFDLNFDDDEPELYNFEHLGYDSYEQNLH